MSKKLLLTGGSGFIGSHVQRLALEKGYQVTVFDRLIHTVNEREVGTSVFVGDIRNREAVMEAIFKHDSVINLAGILGTMETIDNPHPSVDTNIHGALNIFEGCRPNAMLKEGVRGVQITVGNHFMNNTYAITKTTAERFALMYNKEFKTKIAVVRGLNAYGEGQKHKPVRKITPNFALRALMGLPIEVYGDGTQVMDMIYVGDLAEILLRAAFMDHDIYDRPFEAGSGRSTTVLEIAELTNKLTGNQAGIKHLPMRPGEPPHSVVLAKDLHLLGQLEYGPHKMTSLEDGLAKTVEWYRKDLESKKGFTL